MALFGTLDVLAQQTPQHPLLIEGIRYLQNVDMAKMFEQTSPGNNLKVEIKGTDLFAIFQTYDTKPKNECKFEGHQKYIDIQFVFSGEEIIGISGLHQITRQGDYNPDKDIHFSDVSRHSNWLLTPGEGAILFPEDMHAPCMAVEAPLRVKKVVMKVAR